MVDTLCIVPSAEFQQPHTICVKVWVPHKFNEFAAGPVPHFELPACRPLLCRLAAFLTNGYPEKAHWKVASCTFDGMSDVQPSRAVVLHIRACKCDLQPASHET